jgi:hypothetical protein
VIFLRIEIRNAKAILFFHRQLPLGQGFLSGLAPLAVSFAATGPILLIGMFMVGLLAVAFPGFGFAGGNAGVTVTGWENRWDIRSPAARTLWRASFCGQLTTEDRL